MSWIDQAQNNLIIVTGDGREYRPLWKEPTKLIEYNIASFEFPGVEGSLVSRGTPKGRKIPLEVYFVGENHLDDVARFEISASDSRHWVITHPYYGIINAQPASINIDNTQGNVSKIAINLLETIVEENPKGNANPTDVIIRNGEITIDQLRKSLVTTVPVPTTLDKNLLSKNTTAVYGAAKKQVKDGFDVQNYFNLFTAAQAAIINATEDVSQAMTVMQAMINAPFQFVDTIKNRINMLENQFLKLVTSVENIATLFTRPSEKRIYELTAGTIITTMAQASVTNTDYQSVEDVLGAAEILIRTYDQYIANLDSIQTDNGGEKNNYIPDAESMIALQDLVNYTVSKLIEIALDSKQERTLVLEYDSNVIVLAHRLYGLKVDDSTIDYLIDTNNFGLSDILQISAGRKIKYYV